MELFAQYKPFFVFLFRFFAVYAGLALAYNAYLHSFDEAAFEVDSFTQSVAVQTKWLTDAFGYATQIKPHPSQASVMFVLNGHYVSRVVEGCNAISVVILFISFVFAFKGNWKRTIMFMVVGTLLIHALNIVRIALLSMALLHYPQYGHVLHGVVFPAFIYGVVFVLWIIWVNKFSLHARKDR